MWKNSVILVAALLACGMQGASMITAAIPVGEKLVSDRLPERNGAAALSVEMARNEFESCQLAVGAFQGPLEQVTVEIGPLRHETLGTLFPARQIKLFTLGYIETVDLWDPSKVLGEFPDPMMEQAPAQDIASGHSQSYLVQFRTLPDTPVGVYRGEAVLRHRGGDAAERLPLTVTVWDITLSDEQHTANIIPIWGDHLAAMYSAEHQEAARREYLHMLLDYRVSPMPVTDDEIEELGRRGQRYFNIACYPNDYMPDHVAPVLREKAQVWRERGFLEKGYIPFVLLGDEPRPVMWDTVKQQGREVRELFPEAVRINTICVEHQNQLPPMPPDYPNRDLRVYYYRESMVKLDGDVDYFMPCAASCYPMHGVAAEAERLGKKLMWYYIADWLYLPNSATRARLTPWIQWKYRIPGMLHWGMSYWGERNLAGTGGKKWPDVPWDSELSRSGDGYLVYPKPGGAGYWPSLRLENLRDGLEDVELLHLLREAATELRERNPEAAQRMEARVRKVLEVNPALVKTAAEFREDFSLILSERRQAAELLMEINRLLIPICNHKVCNCLGLADGNPA